MYFLLHAKQMQILEFAMLVFNFFYSSLKLFKGKNNHQLLLFFSEIIQRKKQNWIVLCWCNHNNNGNNTTRNWIILLNIISIKKGITQHNLDWGATLALFKEIQAHGWLNFVIGADLLWLVFPRIQQPSKYCMTRTTSASPKLHQKEHHSLPRISLFFLCVYCVLQ